METALPRALAALAALILGLLLVLSAATSVLLGTLGQDAQNSPNPAAAPAEPPGNAPVPDEGPAPDGHGRGSVTGGAVADIPPALSPLYQHAAASCPGLPASVLAAIGKIESDHGRSTLPGVHTGQNPFGAMGPMQIIGSIWASITARHPIPGSPHPSPYNPHDSIYAAADFSDCPAGCS